MKCPLISRRRYEEAVARVGKTVVYEPIGQLDVEPWHFTDEKPGGLCYHSRRIGWVKRLVFDTYIDYMDYLKNRESKDA